MLSEKLEDFRRKARQALDKAAEKVECTAKVSSLRLKIGLTKEDIKHKMADFGRLVLELNQDWSEYPQIGELHNEISILQSRLDELEKQLLCCKNGADETRVKDNNEEDSIREQDEE